MQRLTDFDEKPIYEPYDYNLYNQTTELATGGQRALAGLIDLIIANILNSVLNASFQIDLNLTVGIGFLGSVYLLVRDALPFLDGQSIGKKIMKIRAIELKTGNSLKNNWAISALRSVSLIIPIFNIIDFFMVFSASHQRFGDKWGQTIVVKEEELTSF
jgi:uncharacterized RDD family membrane protein YckC